MTYPRPLFSFQNHISDRLKRQGRRESAAYRDVPKPLQIWAQPVDEMILKIAQQPAGQIAAKNPFAYFAGFAKSVVAPWNGIEKIDGIDFSQALGFGAPPEG